MAGGQEKAIQEMITLLEGYVKKFNLSKDMQGGYFKNTTSATIKVRGLDVTKAEILQMLGGYKKQLSALKKTGEAPEITLDSGLLLNPITPKSSTTTTVAPMRLPTSTTTAPATTGTTVPGATPSTVPGATPSTVPGATPTTTPGNVPSTTPQSSGGTAEQQLAEYEYWIDQYSKATTTVESALRKVSTTGTVGIEGKQYAQGDAVALLDGLRSKLDSWKKLAKPIQESRKSQENKAKNAVFIPGSGDMVEFWQNRFNETQTQEDYNTWQGFLKTYNDAKPKPLPTFQPTKAAKIADLASITPSATAPTATVTPGRVLTQAESKAAATGRYTPPKTVVTGGPTGGAPGKTTPTKAVSPDKIVAQLELRGLPDTPANRKTIQQELTKQPGLSADWKERFIAQYPQYAQYLTDPMYGDDVTQVFQRAMEEQWFKYGDVGLSVFQRELGKTAYGLKTNSAQKAFDSKTTADQNKLVSNQLDEIRTTYGNLGQGGDMPGLTDQEMFNLARESARNGYTTEQQKRAVYSYIYNADPSADHAAVISRVEAGRLGQEVNKIYSDYLLAPDKNAIKRYATGEITLDDVKREARALTSQMYPALKSLIDQGVNVKSISDQYAATAGNVLEQVDTTINMGDPKYRVAFSAKDAAGNPTLMSLGDWQTMLKTNTDYGWQYTKAANSQALNTAAMLARVFGKVE